MHVETTRLLILDMVRGVRPPNAKLIDIISALLTSLFSICSTIVERSIYPPKPGVAEYMSKVFFYPQTRESADLVAACILLS